MITHMNDLPYPSQSGGNIKNQNSNIKSDVVPESADTPSQAHVFTPSASKEIEGIIGSIGSPEVPLTDVSGQELEIPRVVERAGVRVQPTVVPIPPKVQKQGVQPVGANVPAAQQTVVPLTDDQIVQGLKQSVASSWRWLAEWCVRRLKQLHYNMTKGGQSH